MKRILLLAGLCMPLLVNAQTQKGLPQKQPGAIPAYLKQYYFVMLTKGPKRDEITDTAVIAELFRGHMANMKKMAREGKLLVAGPFADDGPWAGLFIFNCSTEEEVRTLLKGDPAIDAGRLAYEVHPWITESNCVFK